MPIVEGPSSAIQPVQMPDMVGNYGRLMQLKQMQQDAPLRQQALQQQVQSGQMDIKQKQREMDSQDAIMQAWSGSGGDLSKAYQTAAKSGKALPGDLAKIKQADFQLQTQALQLLKEKGQRAIDESDYMTGASDAVKSAPPEARPQVYQQQLQNLAHQGIDISQMPPQYPGDQGFNVINLGLQSHKAAMDKAVKDAQTFKDTAQGNEANVNAQLGPAKLAQTQANEAIQRKQEQQRISIESQRLGVEGGRLNLERQKANQASGSATAGGPIDWNATAQKYGMTQGAFDQSAEKFATTGQLPPIGRNANAIAMNRDLMNRAAELHPSANLALNSADFKASQDSLKKVQGTYDMTHAFEQTAEKNMDLLQQTAQNIPELGSKFLNIPARAISSSMIGTENMARFKTALQTAQTEAAKVLNNPNSSGVLSDSARKELQGIIDGNMPVKAMVASLDTLRQDMSNRNTSYQAQINTIQDRIKAGGGGNSSTGNSGSGGKLTVGSFITQGGHKFKVTGVDANGKPTSADPVQ